LTEEGRRLFPEVVPAHEDLIDERLCVLSREEQKKLHELLRQIDRALG
jgi:DNA-binding MarR family transcriptional regulator